MKESPSKNENDKYTRVKIEDAAVLLSAYDEWSGVLHPYDREEYLAKFSTLRNRLKKEGLMK